MDTSLEKEQVSEPGIPWLLHVWDRESWHLLYNSPMSDLYPKDQCSGDATRLWNVKNENDTTNLQTIIELSQSVNQKILVTDLNGHPVSNAHIFITRAMGIDGLDYTYRGDLRTNAMGEVVAEGLPTGYAIIRCLTKKYQVFPAIIEKIPSETVNFTLELWHHHSCTAFQNNSTLPTWSHPGAEASCPPCRHSGWGVPRLGL